LYDQLKEGSSCAGQHDSSIVDENIYNWVQDQLSNGANSGIPGEKQRRLDNDGYGGSPVIDLIEGATLESINQDVASGGLEGRHYFYKVQSTVNSAGSSGQHCWVLREPEGGCFNDQYEDPGQCWRDTHR
jgi:hypothetical protein